MQTYEKKRAKHFFCSDDMAAAPALRAAGAACSHTKPEVYETSNGKWIVEDEFLNFISIRMKTLPQDECFVSLKQCLL